MKWRSTSQQLFLCALLGACAGDGVVSPPLREHKSNVPVLGNERALLAVRRELSLVRERLTAVDEGSIVERRSLEDRARQLARLVSELSELPPVVGVVPSGGYAASVSEGDIPAIWKDDTHTYTHLYLDSPARVNSLTTVVAGWTITGAVLSHTVGGTFTPTGYAAQPIADYSNSVFTTAIWPSETPLPGVVSLCDTYGGSATVGTHHTAGYNWGYLGWKFDDHDTQESKSCTALPQVVVTLADQVVVNNSVQATSSCPAAAPVTWSTTNSEKVTVSVNGLVTGVATGSASIGAICPGMVYGSKQIGVVLADDCEASGGGEATLRGAQMLSQSFAAHNANLAAEDCGTRTDTPGGGSGSEPPVDDPGYQCHWEREFTIYYWPALQSFTWEFTGSWEISCGLAVMREALGVGGSMAPNLQAPKLRLTLLGTGSLKNGRTTSLSRRMATGIEMEIDTTRATAADIENTIRAAQGLAARAAGTSFSGGVIVGGATAAANAAHGSNTRAAKLLRDIKAAPKRTTNSLATGGIVRYLEVEVDKEAVHRVLRQQ